MKSTRGVSLPIASRESNHAHAGHADRLVPNRGRSLEANLDNGSTRRSASTRGDVTCQSRCSSVLRNLKSTRSPYTAGVESRVRSIRLHVACQESTPTAPPLCHGNASQRCSALSECRPDAADKCSRTICWTQTAPRHKAIIPYRHYGIERDRLICLGGEVVNHDVSPAPT